MNVKEERKPADEVRARVAELLLARGWTQERLADEAEVNKATISRFMRGSEIQLETLSKLCAALGVPPADLLAKPPAPARPEADPSIYAYAKPPTDTELLPLLERARQAGLLAQVAIVVEALLAAAGSSSKPTGE